MRIPVIAGNWKMNKTPKEAKEFALRFKEIYEPSDVDVIIAAPYVDLETLNKCFKGTNIKVAAENMHFLDGGAYTGEVSPSMLKEMGIGYCVIGHSERRMYCKESNTTVNKKVKKALETGIVPIVCVGENLKVREAGEAVSFVEKQVSALFKGVSKEDVKKVIVAYEPIWAIGTGITASSEEASEMCSAIRETIALKYGFDVSEEVRILYGGSVKPSNASELMNMDDIDGALVGGASLDPEDFLEIVHF